MTATDFARDAKHRTRPLRAYLCRFPFPVLPVYVAYHTLPTHSVVTALTQTKFVNSAKGVTTEVWIRRFDVY
jgi:hypothetical protein